MTKDDVKDNVRVREVVGNLIFPGGKGLKNTTAIISRSIFGSHQKNNFFIFVSLFFLFHFKHFKNISNKLSRLLEVHLIFLLCLTF